MRHSTLLQAAAFAVIAAGPAVAASPEYDRCIAGIDRGAFVKTQTLDCATRDMDRADGALNATYRAVMARLPEQRQRALRDEERAWIDARRDRCRLDCVDDIPSPEINRMLCLVRETDARTTHLQNLR